MAVRRLVIFGVIATLVAVAVGWWSWPRPHLEVNLATRPAEIKPTVALTRAELAEPAAPAGDWPRFLGPGRDNVSRETGLLRSWPAAGPRLAWEAKGLGDGHASVSVAGGRVFTVGTKGDVMTVFALSEADGKPLWDARVGRLWTNPEEQGGMGGRATPTVDGDVVYANGPTGEVVALAVADGREIWRCDLVKEFGGVAPMWGYADSPLVDGDKVTLTVGGKGGLLIALNKRTGKKIWQSAGVTDEPQFASLVAADIRGVRQVLAVTDVSLSGIDAADGRVLWRVLRKANVKVAVSPIVRGNYVFAVSGSSVGCDLYRIDRGADGAFAVVRIYSNRSLLSQHGGIAMVGGLAYGHSEGKGWMCLDAATGEIRWREKEAFGQGGLTYADGRCYLRNEKSGEIGLIEASETGWKECGRFTPTELSGRPYWAYLVVANERLYVRDQGVLAAYDVKGK